MIQILLGGKRGGWALIDDRDEWATRYRWSLDGRGYVQRARPRSEGRQRVVTLHREILDFPAGTVDHISRDRTDNRRSNLRIVTPKMNAQNVSKRSGTSSQYRGVYRHTQCNRWAATGNTNGRSVYLGLFPTEEAAAEVSRLWRLRHMPGATD